MALDLLLARQAGVISRAQALRAGLSGAAVDRMVRTRRWRPLHPRVYLVPGHGPPGDEARARAALLWAGDGAVLAGAAAAWWHGLTAAAPGTLVVTAPVRRPGRPGVAVRCGTLAAADRTELRGLPVTALALTVLEAAAALGAPAGEQLLDHALLGGLGWADLLAADRRNPGACRSVLTAAAARSDETAAAALLGLLRASGLQGWHRLPGRPGAPATVVFPAARVAVEAVGWAAPPPTPRPGWRVLRFGPQELAIRPHPALAAVVTAVERRDLHHAGGRSRPPTGRSR